MVAGNPDFGFNSRLYALDPPTVRAALAKLAPQAAWFCSLWRAQSPLHWPRDATNARDRLAHFLIAAATEVNPNLGLLGIAEARHSASAYPADALLVTQLTNTDRGVAALWLLGSVGLGLKSDGHCSIAGCGKPHVRWWEGHGAQSP